MSRLHIEQRPELWHDVKSAQEKLIKITMETLLFMADVATEQW